MSRFDDSGERSGLLFTFALALTTKSREGSLTTAISRISKFSTFITEEGTLESTVVLNPAGIIRLLVVW
jgi:hypothetical protein